MTPLLSLESVSKRFTRRATVEERLLSLLGRPMPPRSVHAVDQVSLSIGEGEVVGLVGESGCGKSTLGRIAAGLIVPDGGSALLDGRPVAELRSGRVEKRTTAVQMVFQDPFASLNPRMKVGEAIAEGPLAHGLWPAAERSERVAATLADVGLDPSYAARFPHQFSGGQRARIGIARALAMNPRVVVADEAVAALDVSIQAQVLNTFMDLRARRGIAWLFISHDLGVVGHLADRVAIMYLGRIVELGPAEAVFAAPAHPYTRGLIEAVPRLERRRFGFHPVRGEIPSPLSPPSGCHFHPRCPHAVRRCREEKPTPRQIDTGRMVACHFDLA